MKKKIKNRNLKEKKRRKIQIHKKNMNIERKKRRQIYIKKKKMNLRNWTFKRIIDNILEDRRKRNWSW